MGGNVPRFSRICLNFCGMSEAGQRRDVMGKVGLSRQRGQPHVFPSHPGHFLPTEQCVPHLQGCVPSRPSHTFPSPTPPPGNCAANPPLRPLLISLHFHSLHMFKKQEPGRVRHVPQRPPACQGAREHLEVTHRSRIAGASQPPLDQSGGQVPSAGTQTPPTTVQRRASSPSQAEGCPHVGDSDSHQVLPQTDPRGTRAVSLTEGSKRLAGCVGKEAQVPAPAATLQIKRSRHFGEIRSEKLRLTSDQKPTPSAVREGPRLAAPPPFAQQV